MQPNFAALAAIDEAVMQAKLRAVRAATAHPGEKGRELELHVRSLLHDILPAEYKLTTGFVAWRPSGEHEIELSSQLDIIIYDSLLGPIIRFDSFDVVPLEAVYGYVEVKATISTSSATASNSLAACLESNAAIRRMRTRWFNDVFHGSPPNYSTDNFSWLAPRAFVVAFDCSDRGVFNADKFAAKLATEQEKKNGTVHIHGLLVPGKVFCYTVPHGENSREDERFDVHYTPESTMLAFKAQLLLSLATFQRPGPGEGRPAVDMYFTATPQWKVKRPSSAVPVRPSQRKSNHGRKPRASGG